MTVATRDQIELPAIERGNVESAVTSLVDQAAQLQASDLCFLMDEDATTIAVRRFGSMQRVATVSQTQGKQLISCVKALAGMDIAQHRRPLDGRWLVELAGRSLDVRINTIATLFGEDMTMRLWDRDSTLRSLDQLGLTHGQLSTLLAMLERPSGLILVTGPTGAGKTTTLYACLQYLNNGSRKINTLEDPIEYAIQGVRQSQVSEKIGVGFAELLRNVLRQAPDVIMVGEIRDEATAITAVRAANSGHLVLATLHSPIAAAAVRSMLSLGSHPYFLSNCLLGVVAQRLVRTLCPACRESFPVHDVPQIFADIRPHLNADQGRIIYGPRGCDACLQSGYDGRIGLFEIMPVTGGIRQLLAESSTSESIQAAAIRNGMLEFRRGALLKVAQGITSTEEILRGVPAEYLG